jgi:hypothetical protein
VILLKLKLDNHERDEFGWRGNLGIELSKWCQELGLIRDQDYSWALMTGINEIHFRFYGEDQSFASMFALKWGKYL